MVAHGYRAGHQVPNPTTQNACCRMGQDRQRPPPRIKTGSVGLLISEQTLQTGQHFVAHTLLLNNGRSVLISRSDAAQQRSVSSLTRLSHDLRIMVPGSGSEIKSNCRVIRRGSTYRQFARSHIITGVGAAPAHFSSIARRVTHASLVTLTCRHHTRLLYTVCPVCVACLPFSPRTILLHHLLLP